MRADIESYNQALDYAKAGLWSPAEVFLVKAIDLNPEEAEYHSLLGVVRLGLGMKRLAMQHFQDAYYLNCQDPLLQHYKHWLETS
jgi:Flp pilus assembly protein TadD